MNLMFPKNVSKHAASLTYQTFANYSRQKFSDRMSLRCTMYTTAYYYFASGMGAKYCDQCVCMSVWLTYLKNHTRRFHD